MRVYVNRNIDGVQSPSIFAANLVGAGVAGVEWTTEASEPWDVALAVISASRALLADGRPVVQRLDGIYLDLDSDYRRKNRQILDTFRRAAGVVYQSHFARRVAETNFGRPDCPTTVIHNGAETAAPAPWPVQSDGPRLIAVASWRAVKRLGSVVAGAREYARTHPDTSLLIVGDVPPAERAAEEWSGVTWLGSVPHQRIAGLQAAADVCLNLSFMDACPNAVIEATAAGTPCVVTSHQGAQEVSGWRGVTLDLDPWDYWPICYGRDVLPLDPSAVAEGIRICVGMGRGVARPDLGLDVMASKYVGFLRRVCR